jgi:hypothetical protein
VGPASPAAEGGPLDVAWRRLPAVVPRAATPPYEPAPKSKRSQHTPCSPRTPQRSVTKVNLFIYLFIHLFIHSFIHFMNSKSQPAIAGLVTASSSLLGVQISFLA